MKINEFEEDDKILFNDRKIPLTVVKAENNSLEVKGPSGGLYEIYKENENLLWCKKGERKYSSYCENLRNVGRWIRENKQWKHSSGTKIRLEKNEIGYWEIKSDKDKITRFIDQPKYGFSDKETAIKEINKAKKKFPKG